MEGLRGVSALDVAESLQVALANRGIRADVNGDYGLAVVSVWAGLTVWCNGNLFWWNVGQSPATRNPVYAQQPAVELEQATRRVIRRYVDLRQRQTNTPTSSTSPQVDHGPR